MKTFSFEKSECWQKAKELAVLVYKITINFPVEERFAIISLMRGLRFQLLQQLQKVLLLNDKSAAILQRDILKQRIRAIE